MDLFVLKNIVDNEHITDTLVDGLNQTFEKYEINTPLRQAHFLAQCLVESDSFRTSKEYASGEEYEGRLSLGNTQPGDGVKYKGRGRIQITGRENYTLASQSLGIDCVDNPELLEASPTSELVSGWYWNTHNLNFYADLDDIRTITVKINGGLNGFPERCAWLVKCKQAIGV